MTVIAAGSVTFGTESVAFSTKSAHATGEALSIKGVGVGVQFIGFTFEAHEAQIGCAAYVTSSVTAVTESRSNGPIQNPTTFDRCKFVGNEAKATGGAIDAGVGFDNIIDAFFKSNTTGTGEALRLAGTTILHDCTFVENTSNGNKGPAISNTGFVSSITACSFVRNAFECEPGEFLDFHATHTVSQKYKL